MKIRLERGLPFVELRITYRGHDLVLPRAVLDTGSGSTVVSTDRVAEIGLRFEPADIVHRIRGVGGAEFVYTKRVDRMSVGTLSVTAFEVEVGGLDYGFDLDAIIGTDFLTSVGAVSDLGLLEIRTARSSP